MFTSGGLLNKKMYYKIYNAAFSQKIYLFPEVFDDLSGVKFEKILSSFLKSHTIKYASSDLTMKNLIQGALIGKVEEDGVRQNIFMTTEIMEDFDEFAPEFVKNLTLNKQRNLKNLLNSCVIYIETLFTKERPANLILKMSTVPGRFLHNQLKLNEFAAIDVFHFYRFLRWSVVPKNVGIYVENDQTIVNAKEITSNVKIIV